MDCLLFRDIRVGDQNGSRIAGRIAYQFHAASNKNSFAVLRRLPQLAGPFSVVAQIAFEPWFKAVMKQVLNILAKSLGRPPTVEPFRTSVPHLDAILEVADDQCILREVE